MYEQKIQIRLCNKKACFSLYFNEIKNVLKMFCEQSEYVKHKMFTNVYTLCNQIILWAQLSLHKLLLNSSFQTSSWLNLLAVENMLLYNLQLPQIFVESYFFFADFVIISSKWTRFIFTSPEEALYCQKIMLSVTVNLSIVSTVCPMKMKVL